MPTRSRSAASTSWPRRRPFLPRQDGAHPRLEAGCSLAASITADQLLRAWKEENLGAVVVSYVNTTAEVKAESDYCCTSGNAKGVIESIPDDTEILFFRHVPRPLVEEGHGPKAADLDGRVPRPRWHPAA